MHHRPARLRVLGHPLHTILTHLPIALWVVAVACDALWLRSDHAFWWACAYWSTLAGTILAVPAAVVGFVDYLTIPARDPAYRVATWHLIAAGAAILLFAVSAVFRRGPQPPGETPFAAIACGALGLVALVMAGWLGGELVYRFGLGVSLGADQRSPPPS